MPLPSSVSTQRHRLTGLGAAVEGGILVSESVSIDLLGNAAVSRTVLDRAARRVVQTSDSPASTLDALSVSVNGLTLTNVTSTGVATIFAYDSLGRRVASTSVSDPLNPEPRTLSSFTGYNSLGQLAWTADAANTTNRYAYDSFTGRRVAVTNALGQATHTAYDAEGRVVATWGATYPVAYEYDAFGRMAAMATTRDPAHESVNLLTLLPAGVHLSHTSHASYPSHILDTTRWLYHEPTGLLTNKVYADGKGTAYSYTPDGKLATRTWARGITTAYSYDPFGQLAGIEYGQAPVPGPATPAVAFAYDRLGRQLSAITAGVSTNLFAYDALTLALANETVIAYGETNVLTRTQDTLGRPAGLSVAGLGEAGPAPYSLAYGYDAYGRFHSVSSLVVSVESVATYSYVPGSHLRAGVTIINPDTPTLPYSHTFHYEPHRDLFAAVSNTWGGTLISAFDYTNDALGRRTARVDTQPALDPVQNVFGYNVRSEVQSALMGTNTYGYVFDPIGNRIAATNNAVATAYLANELNQYTNVVLEGEAPSEPHHDADGNLLSNGEWSFAWDGENRLLAASNATTLVTYVHDFQSRRIGRKQYTWDTDHWTPVADKRFLYDGWALIREMADSGSVSATNHFVYGLDLSGSIQGAGTIGGILSANLNGTTVFYTYDGNGNVTDLVDTNGVVVEHYEYSPFGETIAQSRNPAFTQSQPFRFSTKRQDESTGLLYYGYRDLDTVWGRWLSRDPIEETGGVNLHAFVRNASVFRADSLGKCEISPNPFTLDNISVFYGPTSDPTYRAETIFNKTLDCDCICTGPNKERDPYKLKCTINIVTPVIIIINPALAEQAPGGSEGRLGHEQIHVRNGLRFLTDLASAIGGCEQLQKASFSECEKKKNDLIIRYSALNGEFGSRERDHLNFVHPVSGDGYHPHGLVGPPQPGNYPFPDKVTPRPPGLVGAGYFVPTTEKLCLPW